MFSMFRTIGKNILKILGIKPSMVYKFYYKEVSKWSIRMSIRENGYCDLVKRLRGIVPDISNQEEGLKDTFNDYWELKYRALHAFQCNLMHKALENFSYNNLQIVDIGDSAGTHMLYLKGLTNGKFKINTLSINLDQRAVDKIKDKGLDAMLSDAEKLDFKDKNVDLFTSFETMEHLHNPAIFLRRLAKKSNCGKLLITVPYMKNSRVGLRNIRYRLDKIIFSEDEHIFELSPKDWTLLMLHCGWKVIYNAIYYQYPKKWPVVSGLLKLYWRNNDFEGFWGAILEKDLHLSDRYQHWED